MVGGATQRVSYGAELTFETILGGDEAATCLREEADTLLRIIDGIVRLTVDGAERLLGAGDEAIVPAGASYRIESAGESARFVTGSRTVRR
jgi:mannose-6-phosphate isomerase-like protein (cupin superfamily)